METKSTALTVLAYWRSRETISPSTPFVSSVGRKKQKKGIINANNINNRDMTQETEQGIIVERLPDLRFRVSIDSGEVIAYLGGKMKHHKIQLLIGDRVLVVLDPYGGKATNRIIRRI